MATRCSKRSTSKSKPKQQHALNNDVIPTPVITIPQDVPIRSVFCHTEHSNNAVDFTPLQYVTLVQQGLLKKSSQHNHLVALAKIPGSENDTKITLMTCTSPFSEQHIHILTSPPDS